VRWRDPLAMEGEGRREERGEEGRGRERVE
jgi:hypothetical protein